jgi:hypothetical protein
VTGETTHERLATTWVKAVADKIKNAYPSVGGYFIAGDFNIKKCAINVAPPPSMPRESTTCAPRSWWTTLTTPSYSYSDTEWARNSTTQSQFDAQFRDGCIEFDSPTSDMCSTDGLRHFREKRIDFVFSASGNKVVNPVDASHDLTCGIKRGNYAPHCDDHGNPQYYSDHRLTWTYVAMS